MYVKLILRNLYSALPHHTKNTQQYTAHRPNKPLIEKIK